MKKWTFARHLIITLIFIQSYYLQAQNLVPNYSFEDTLQCPNHLNQLACAVGWYKPTVGSSDYFNTCSNSLVGVPSNFNGWEYAQNGLAYVGIITCIKKSNIREYVQTQMIDTLVAGSQYSVSFYVSLADSSKYACNNIGAYLSQTPVNVANNLVLPYVPQVANSTANQLSNKNGWVLVSDTVTALGDELYITIGNFNDDWTSDTLLVGGGGNGGSYYYIDNVSVQRVGSGHGINEKDNQSAFEVFPNPGNGMLNIRWLVSMHDVSTFEVLNVLGETVNSGQLDRSTKTEIDLRERTNGIYFLRIKKGSSVFSQKIVIQK